MEFFQLFICAFNFRRLLWGMFTYCHQYFSPYMKLRTFYVWQYSMWVISLSNLIWECRGRSPLLGCEVKPKTSFSKQGVQRTKSFAGVWGPRIWGMQQWIPTNFLFAAAGGES